MNTNNNALHTRLTGTPNIFREELMTKKKNKFQRQLTDARTHAFTHTEPFVD